MKRNIDANIHMETQKGYKKTTNGIFDQLRGISQSKLRPSVKRRNKFLKNHANKHQISKHRSKILGITSYYEIFSDCEILKNFFHKPTCLLYYIFGGFYSPSSELEWKSVAGSLLVALQARVLLFLILC